jgi:uncharacterized membrane protein YtjA (UPF0391 family)
MLRFTVTCFAIAVIAALLGVKGIVGSFRGVSKLFFVVVLISIFAAMSLLGCIFRRQIQSE